MEIITASGVKAKINAAPFVDAMALQQVVLRESARSGLTDDLKGKALDDIKGVDIATFLPAIMQMLGSPEILAAIMRCLERCTYAGERITATTFDDEEARGDFYQVAMECVKTNLAPFFRSLLLGLSEGQAKREGSLK